MRTSTLLALLGATLAIGSPIHQALHKRAITWDIVTEIVTVTVTEGNLPTPSSTPVEVVTVQQIHWVDPVPATTSEPVVPTSTIAPPPPPPPPTTSSTPPPPPPPPSTTSQAPAPAPTTQAAAVFAATPEVEVQPASSSSPVAAPESAPAPSDLASTVLYHHNAHRANHSASALTWDQKLAGYAQITANKCSGQHDMSEGGGGYGQNINTAGLGNALSDPNGAIKAQVEAWDPKIVLADAISNGWYGEYTIYDGENPNGQSLYGLATPPTFNGVDYMHFTQIAWKSTTSVGCASAYCGSGNLLVDPVSGSAPYVWFTVCNYGPAGNFLGEFDGEVGESLGLASIGNVPAAWEQ